MAFKSLGGSTGYLTVGTTPVRITDNLIGLTFQSQTFTAGKRLPAHTIFVQQHQSNTGFLCLSTVSFGMTSSADINITSGIGILEKLIPPYTVNGSLTGLAWLAFTIPYAPGGMNASDYYLISDVGSQKAIVSFIQA